LNLVALAKLQGSANCLRHRGLVAVCQGEFNFKGGRP